MDGYRDHPDFDDHECVVFHDDDRLKAIIAVHSSAMGPAAGGCRMYPYTGMADALTDVLRLSRGMTYKSALAGLPLGGGKSVIIGDPHTEKSPELLAAMGDFIDSLGGRYVAAEDSGTCVRDLQTISERTRHVAGLVDGEEHGGDPSPVTAYGVFKGIQSSVEYRGLALEGIRVAIQGVGNVGYFLASLLTRAGAEVIVADVNAQNVQRAVQNLGVTAVSVAEILAIPADVLAPCALGGAINVNSVGSIRAGVVAGAANNQLADAELGWRLHERGILYAPDYVINAGGVIDVHYQRIGNRDQTQICAHVDQIGTTLTDVYRRADHERRPTSEIADEMAREVLCSARSS